MPSDLVSTEWLAANLGSVVVLDATWFLPTENRDAAAEYASSHIPGAARFDIDAIADRTTQLPHMLPGAASFARDIGALGVGNDSRVVVYDRNAMACAARVWWTLRTFGHDAVALLDGGFAKWTREGRAVEASTPKVAPKRFTARRRAELVADLPAMQAASTRGTRQIVDARAAGRFRGTEPEPRPGLRGGHIPGSRNLPFRSLLQDDGTLLAPEALRARFAAASVDTAKPVIALCGSGVTAALIAFALHRVGAGDAAVYDGSWAEWGALADAPVAT
jgi:thiosulfate/3-mercaptopyruvate sulfurtransferase